MPLNTEFIAATAPGQSGRLMVVLHGLGDSLRGFRWVPEALRLPWLNFLLVDAPDTYYGGFSWYDLHLPEKGVNRSRALLTDLLTELPGKGFAPGQTILSGFSQGCLMSIDVAARYPHHLAGVIGISGYVHDPVKLLREKSKEAAGQKFLITHGTEDAMIPINLVREQMEELRAGGLQIEWHEFVKGHTIAGEKEIAVVRSFIEKQYE